MSIATSFQEKNALDSAEDLARSASEAPRMGGLALVTSGDEVLRRLGIERSFDFSIHSLLRRR